ncbi:hypothetical protein [Burkholderia stabilis]|nr:hypothetical protein [Burkholderia stabilis]
MKSLAGMVDVCVEVRMVAVSRRASINLQLMLVQQEFDYSLETAPSKVAT